MYVPEIISDEEAWRHHDFALGASLLEMAAQGSGSRAYAVPEAVVEELEEDASFHYYPSDERWRGTGSHRPVILKPGSVIEKMFLSADNRPALTDYAQRLEENIQRFGIEQNIPLLSTWTADRVVVNKIRPDTRLGGPGRIHRHKDPDMESGVAVVVRIDEATSTVWKPDRTRDGKLVAVDQVQKPGHLTVYACADLSHALGFGQPEHAVAADETSLSLVFLHTPFHKPFSLRSVIERHKR